jgi:hypothetical protein
VVCLFVGALLGDFVVDAPSLVPDSAFAVDVGSLGADL